MTQHINHQLKESTENAPEISIRYKAHGVPTCSMGCGGTQLSAPPPVCSPRPTPCTLSLGRCCLWALCDERPPLLQSRFSAPGCTQLWALRFPAFRDPGQLQGPLLPLVRPSRPAAQEDGSSRSPLCPAGQETLRLACGMQSGGGCLFCSPSFGQRTLSCSHDLSSGSLDSSNAPAAKP